MSRLRCQSPSDVLTKVVGLATYLIGHGNAVKDSDTVRRP
jgi:hypothetical protein